MAILILLLAALLYFLFTGRQPTNLIGVSQLGKPAYLFSIYGDAKSGRLQKPMGVAVNTKKNIVYVADTLSNRIAAFDTEGKALFSFEKIDKGKLRNPSYVAVNPKDHTVLVADPSYASVFIFDSRGKFIKKFLPNNNKKFPWVPLGISFDKDNNMYVADKGLNRIVQFSPGGKRLLSIGKTGMIIKKIKEKPGLMYFPNDSVVDSDGNIYVSDSNNQRLQIFDSKGKFKKMIPIKGLPRGLAIVEGGSSAGLYVVNTFDHQVQVFSKDGDVLFTFGELGQGEGEFRYPNDIAIADSRLYITDRENNRVQVWRF